MAALSGERRLSNNSVEALLPRLVLETETRGVFGNGALDVVGDAFGEIGGDFHADFHGGMSVAARTLMISSVICTRCILAVAACTSAIPMKAWPSVPRQVWAV